MSAALDWDETSQDPDDAPLLAAAGTGPRTNGMSRAAMRRCGRCCVVVAFDADLMLAARGCAHCQAPHGPRVPVLPEHADWAASASQASQRSHEDRCPLG